MSKDRTRVCVELTLEELQRRVGRFADNWGQRFMRKRELVGRCRHLVRLVDFVDTMSGTVTERVGDFP